MKRESPVLLAVVPSKIPHDPTGLAAMRLEQILDRSLVPAAVSCGMVPIRLDTCAYYDITERRVIDQILLSDIVVFDLTFPDPVTAYLFGTRRAFRSKPCLVLRSSCAHPTLSIELDDAIEYPISGQLEAMAELNLKREVTEALLAIKNRKLGSSPDYAHYELITEYQSTELSRLKTDQFRQRVEYSEALKKKLEYTRKLDRPQAIRQLREVERQLAPLQAADSAVLVDLFLSYRAVSAWTEMRRLYEAFPLPLKRSTMLREQFAMAMNRCGERQNALTILKEIETSQGPSSETCSLIGRVYKDYWQDSEKTGDNRAAESYLSLAIAAYRRGFEADWRDAYPGINAVTLLDIQGTSKTLSDRDSLLPIVRFAVQQRLKHRKPDYWDHATLLELSVLEEDRADAELCLQTVVSASRESWERETTANNLTLLEKYRRNRGQDTDWLAKLINGLTTT